MSVAPYPHIKMGVRDESIATILEEEVMPLDKPLYFCRAPRGAVGIPTWNPTYQRAVLRYGQSMFNKRSEYWSEQSYFLLKTLTMNGAFIMRVTSDQAEASQVILECGVKTDIDVPQWDRNSITGAFALADDGSRVKINSQGKPCAELTEDTTTYKPSEDSQIVVDQKYLYRDYAEYTYTPYKRETADKDMVVWFGTGAVAASNYTWYTAATLTAEIRAKNFVFKNVGTVAAPELEYVPEDDDLDPAAYYCTIKFNSYDCKVVRAGENLWDAADGDDPDTQNDGLGKYYTRTPVISSGFEYKELTVGASAASSNTDVVIGDKIAANYDITRDTEVTNYVATTDETPDPDKKYYIENASTESGYALAGTNGKVTAFVEGTTYFEAVVTTEPTFVTNVGRLYVEDQVLKVANGDYEPQACIAGGVQLMWRAVIRNPRDEREIDSAEPSQDRALGITWYPMISFMATSPGVWGQSFGFRFFYDRSQNTLSQTRSNGSVKYTLAPVELKEGDTTPSAITTAYGEVAVTGTSKLDVVDPSTELDISLKKLLPANYSGSRELPVTVYWMPENFEVIGRMVMEAEINAKEQIKVLYPELLDKDETGDKTLFTSFVDDLFGLSPDGSIEDALAVLEASEDAGYMANIVSCVSSSKVPYFASEVVGTFNEATGTETTVDDVIDVNDDTAFYLQGGHDGGENGVPSDPEVEKYIRDQIDACIAGTQEYLVDYLRCPYNNIIDTGVSLKTKKSYLDFMGVRDNLTVFLTPQQIWKQRNADTGELEYPPQLSRFEDESTGAILRSYGLLMREDIENCTEANRAIIFLASGINSDHDWNPGNLVASTLWIALKNAQYLSGQIIREEPIERPNSEITCYDGGMTWTAANEETRSRCWNAGLNYAQYFDQDGIHYASCRSIYRYDTSVLCDMGTVRMVTFCKDIIRKEWSIWAGSKRKADDLNERITKALNNKIATMLNGKYEFTVNVYQTDEDKKYGYVRHVDLTVTSPATNRVWLATIIVRREGFDPNAQD
jgi:hypothetical protein